MFSSLLSRLKLHQKLTLLIGVIFIVPIIFMDLHITNLINREYFTVYGEKVMDVAKFLASDPLVIGEMTHPGSTPFEELDQHMKNLTKATQVRFITLMNMQGIRLYHPEHDRIGKRFAGGDEERALQGETYISSAQGTLGFSQRAFVPVFAEGKQVGAISVGILSDAIQDIVKRVSEPVNRVLLLFLGFGLVCSVLLARSIKKILLGLEPEEIATMFEERNAMLRIIKDGIIAFDRHGNVTLVNDEAERILCRAGMQECLDDNEIVNEDMREAVDATLASGKPVFDQDIVINRVALIANHIPIIIGGVTTGVISTFRDMSEVREMAERITDINKYVDALRSQTHEFMNKLHAIMGLVHDGNLENLKRYIGELADIREAETRSIYSKVKDPVVAGFLSSKYSNARERGVNVAFDLRGTFPPIVDRAFSHAMVTILGNLMDNGMDAVQETAEKKLEVTLAVGEETLDIIVTDTGDGMDEDNLSIIFAKGYSTKGDHRGLGLWLVLKTLDSFNGSIDVQTQPGAGTTLHVRLPVTGIFGDASC